MSPMVHQLRPASGSWFPVLPLPRSHETGNAPLIAPDSLPSSSPSDLPTSSGNAIIVAGAHSNGQIRKAAKTRFS